MAVVYNTTAGLVTNFTNTTTFFDCKLKDSVDSVFGANGNYVASSVVGIAILLAIVAYTRYSEELFLDLVACCD